MTARRWLAAAATVLLALAAVGPTGRAAPREEVASDSRPLIFRRILAPADRIAELARGCLPIKRSELARLASLASRVTGAASFGGAEASIQQATYWARYDRGRLAGGVARLEVIHRGAGAAAAPLAPCDLAMGDPVWEGDSPQAATAGLDGDGQLVVLAEHSATLRFPWSLQGLRSPLGETRFDIRLPASPVNRMILWLPASMIPVTDRGAVSRLGAEEAEAARKELASGPRSPLGEGGESASAWLVEVGGNTQFGLRVTPRDAFRRNRPLVLLQTSAVYRCTPAGVELSMDLHLDVYHEPIRQLTLRLDPSIELTAVRLGDTPLAAADSGAGKDGRRRLVVEFPQPLLGAGRIVRLSALAPLTFGRRWRLPTVGVEEASWQQGRAELETPRSLLLTDLETHGCRQTEIGPLPPPDAGELRRFQFYSQDAAIDVVVEHRPVSLRVRTGTTISWGGAAPTARVVCDLETLYGETFLLRGEMSRPWIIDAVESVPPEAIDQYDVTAQPPYRQLLQVSLKRAVSPQHRVRLLIRAHRRSPPPSSGMSRRSFHVLDFPAAAESRCLTVVNAPPPYRLKLSGDMKLERLQAQDLSLEDKERVQPGPDSLIFVDGPAAQDLRIAREKRPPRYDAEIVVDASIQGAALTESYRIGCQPDATPVDRLLVRFSEPRETPLRWSWAGKDKRPLAARRVDLPAPPESGDEMNPGAGVGPGGELWEVDLPGAPQAAFELQAVRTTPFAGKTAISLASLPKAIHHTGVLTVRSLDGRPLQIDMHGAQLLPPPPPPSGRSCQVRAHCRYAPSQNARVIVTPAAEEAGQASAWAWSCEITSWLPTSGPASHELLYRLENTGRREVLIRTPSGLRVDQLLVNGVEVPVPAARKERATISAPLPSGRRFPTVLLRCSGPRGDLRVFDEVASPAVQIDVPVLAQRWIVWLPPGYESRSPRAAAPTPTRESSWDYRLFGPLLARRSGEAAGLFSGAGEAHGRHGRSDSERIAEAEELLRLLGEFQKPENSPSQRNPTWGDLLTSYLRWIEKQYKTPPPQLWIDQTGLAARGVTARTPVPPATGATPRDRGAALLQRFNLALAIHPEGLALCSDTTLAAGGASFRRSDRAPIFWLDQGRRFDRWSGPSAWSSRWVPVAAWVAEPPTPGSPWPTAGRTDYAAVAQRGWRVCVVDLTPGRSGRIPVYRLAVIDALGWGLFLAAAAWGIGLGGARWPRLVGAAAVSAAAALLLPAALVPPARGVFLGVLMAGFLGAARRRRAPRNPPDAATGSTRRGPAVSALLLPLCVLAGAAAPAARGWAGEAAKAALTGRDADNAYWLLIPVDPKERPVGEYVYVPRAAYNQLHRRAAAAERPERPWLLRSARYAGELRWAGGGTRLDIDQLTASFRIQVFRAPCQVILPFGRRGIQLLRSELDGALAAIRWSSDNRNLLLDVETPGEHRLDVAVRPVTQIKGRTTGFDLDVPPVANSELRLAAPADASGIRFPSSLGARALERETGRLVSALGPTRRLSVQWPTDPGLGIEPAELEAEEYLWLRVRPGSVVLDANFRFLVRAGRVTELKVLADPHLRPLPLRGDEPVTGFVRTVSGDVTTIHWELASPVDDEILLPTSFYMSGTSGVGHFRLPRLQPIADRTVRRWLAVSVDPSLQCDRITGASLERVDADEFAAVWGEPGNPPLGAWKLPAEEAPWSIATSFRAPRTTADQRLDVSVARDAMNVAFQAQLNTTGGGCFQYRLRAPAELRIRDVSLRQGDAERLVRFRRAPSGAVNLFLSDAVSGRQQLTVRGVAPLSEYASMKLPQISIEGVESRGYQVRVYRRPEVLLRLEKPPELAAAPNAPLGQYQPGLGRLVASWEAPRDAAEGQSPAIHLVATPNRSRRNGRLVTRLRRAKGAWSVEADYRVRTRRGVIDEVRLEVPDGWIEPFQLDPPVSWSLTPGPAGQRRRLVIRPPQAAPEKYRIRIHCAVPAPRDGRFGPLLDVSPLDAEAVDRLLVLPTRVGEQKTAWETSGLQETELPKEANDSPAVGEAAPVCYRVVRPRFEAAMKQVTPATSSPQVWLADIQLAWRPDGFVQGLAAFDLAPADLDRCVIEVPPGLQLVRVSRSGLPASMAPLQGRRWEVRLASSRLPLRIEALFTGRLDALAQPGGDRVLRAPFLENLPVERTLWTVYSPPQFALLAPDPPDSQVDARRQDAFRFRTAAMLVERACDESWAGMEPEEARRWYAPWARRLVACQSRIARELISSPHDEEFGELEISSLVQRQEELARELDAEDMLEEARAEADAGAESAAVWQLACPPRAAPTRCVFQGPVDRATLVSPSSDWAAPWFARSAAAAVLLCLALVIRLPGPRRSIGEWLVRWPHFALVLLGLAWSLWFAPSFLGWIFVAVGIFRAVFPAWRTVAEFP